jgi:hypothetical protein
MSHHTNLLPPFNDVTFVQAFTANPWNTCTLLLNANISTQHNSWMNLNKIQAKTLKIEVLNFFCW